MSLDNIRVNELAKELNLSSKEVLDKFVQLSITGKTHSSTVTADQAQRLKDFISAGSKIEVKKPKAFIVKKAKVEPKEETLEVERKEEKHFAKPQIEVVKPPQNRLEIVRRAPQRPQGSSEATEQRRPYGSKPEGSRSEVSRPEGARGDFRGPRPPYPQRPQPTGGDGKFQKPAENREGQGSQGAPGADRGDQKQPIQRHIISQDIYDNKGGIKRKTMVDKKKGKVFTTKEEEQERISLEKAAAQRHKKKQQRDEEVEEVTKIVVNQALTISELSKKIQKTPAEIVRFLMMQGIMATVNQLIDVDTIKKVCAEFELEEKPEETNDGNQ